MVCGPSATEQVCPITTYHESATCGSWLLSCIMSISRGRCLGQNSGWLDQVTSGAPPSWIFLVLVLNDKAADLGSERKSDPASLLHKNAALQHVHNM